MADIPVEKVEKVEKVEQYDDIRPGASPEKRQKYRSWVNKVRVIRRQSGGKTRIPAGHGTDARFCRRRISTGSVALIV